jgi:preprotein translocase subunit YajC
MFRAQSNSIFWRWFRALAASFLVAGLCAANAQTSGSAAGDAAIVKAVGTIKTVQADSITVAVETGGDLTAKLAATTKILRVPPGEKDLKNATVLQAQDLQPGDRVLVRGQAASEPHTIAALAVIVMKQGDISAKQQRERDDWQKRGVGGLVGKVDVASSTITISTGGLGPNKNVNIHVGKDTVLRRYAPDSVKFDEAKPAPIDQIKAGDQLRARGARSADGTELTAEEVVSGSFRNIAGTITAIDAAGNSMTVKDLIAKTTVVVLVSSDSQMKKLPAEMAQRIAARFKRGAAANGNGESAGTQNASAQGSAGADSHRGADSSGGPGNGGAHAQGGSPGGNGAPDMQRMLGRLPNSTLADLQKGDAVMIVSTQGGGSGKVSAITLLAGVEPILAAAPTQSYSLLSPWSLNSSGGESEGAQ